MNSLEWVGGNLDAGPLAAYAFMVGATIGHRDMTYVFVRYRRPDQVLTVVRINSPATLKGTEVVIREATNPSGCHVETLIPTMRAPREIRPPQLFDTLPLTDISYLDLIRSISPSLFPPPTTTPVDNPSGAAGGIEVTYTRDGIVVTELHTDGLTTPVLRTVAFDGKLERSWQVVEAGSADDHHVPATIVVTRANLPKPTTFRRLTPVVRIDRTSQPATAANLLDRAAAHLGRL
jgi:hypothetical protein